MKSKPKVFIWVMIAMILIFSTSIVAYRNTIMEVESNAEKTVLAFKEEQFKVIWSGIENFQMQSETKITKISENIEKDILALSSEDLAELHDDMSNNQYNENLHSILMSNIEGQNLNDIKNHKNGIVVMTTKGYIEDFNYRRAKTTNDGDNLFRSWDYDIKHSYNKELEENAIDKLLNRTSGIIAFESYDLIKNSNHIKIKEMNYESLLEVFLQEGMEGLRNYQIFVPYYITDIGDIFGIPDISQGVKVENNKIIVAQEFNLYDQIMNIHNDSFKNDQIENIMARYNNVLRWLYICGIALVTAVCCIIFYFCTFYNQIVLNEDNEDANLQIENEAPRTSEMQNQE